MAVKGSTSRASHFAWFAVLLTGCLLAGATPVSADEPAPATPSTASVRRITVPLPITGTVDTNVIQLLDRLLSRLPRATVDARPIVVLEFRASDGASGEGSQFERSLALARYLAGERLRQVRTVAYVPRAVTGHAVLPVLACEELVLAPTAVLGDATATDEFVDPTMRRGYVEIAERRRTVPTALVLGMLEPTLAVYRVKTAEGVRFVDAQELDALQKQGLPQSVETIKREGDRGKFTGSDLRTKFGLPGHLAADPTALAQALHVPVRSLESDPSLEGGWRPLRVELKGPLNSKLIHWILQRLEARVRGGDRNFVCLWIESPGGAAADSLTLATFLSELPESVRTVAFVPNEARADAGLIALACDQLVVGPAAVIGGPGTNLIDIDTLQNARQPIQEIAQRQSTVWSPLLATFDPALDLHRYQREGTDELRLMCAEEHEGLGERGVWQRGPEVSLRSGLTGHLAMEVGIARLETDSFDELRRFYQLEEELELARPNWAHLFIERLASPRLAALLLFIAWMALIIEFMTPNMTGAGFVSGFCFLLYFWSKYLHGTAGALEILLFLAGAICVALEVFVIPGFGIFGFGGGLMIVASLILASQTFVIPRNSYQLAELSESLLTVVAGGCGVVTGMVLIRRFLPRAPVLRRMMLVPPLAEELAEIEERERLVDHSQLVGRRGVTTTRLMPSGKAQFGDDLVDVITAGEMIDRGATVQVVESLGSRVVVRAV